MRGAPQPATVEKDRGDPVCVFSPRGFRGGLRIRRVVGESQAQAGQFAAGIAAQTEAGQLYGAQEAGFGEKGLRSKVPHRLLLSGCKSWSQPAQEIGACLGKAVAHAFEREQRVHGKGILAHRSRVGVLGLVGEALLLEDATSPVVGSACGEVDLFAREAAHVLVEPMQGLVPIVRAPSGEGQTPQSLARHIALGIAVRQIAQALLGAVVVASIGQYLGRTQAGVVRETVLGKLGLDAGVESQSLVGLAC